MLLLLKNQLIQISQGGITLFLKKIYNALGFVLYFPLCILFFPILILIRLISPFFIIRFGELVSSRIGHLAANTELYLCEKDSNINVPNKPYIDIFYLRYKPYCNKFLIDKWDEILHIYPKWLIHPIYIINRFIPYGEKHTIGSNSQHDRDIHNLLDNTKQHLFLSKDENQIGLDILKEMGIPVNSRIVCLLVRDSAYLSSKIPSCNWNYHNYRDNNVENYLLAAEYLVEQGFFVFRMGRVVNKPFFSNKTGIIDYANSKYASDFMDIYLGSICTFCISTGAGWDAVPAWIFRKPTIFTNLVPFGYLPTFSNKFLLTTKRHYSKILKRELTVSEIFNFGLHNCMSKSSYQDNEIDLVENTPEELKNVVIEMIENIKLNFNQNNFEKINSTRFWILYSELNSKFNSELILHGKFKSRFSISYLKNNKNWIK